MRAAVAIPGPRLAAQQAQVEPSFLHLPQVLPRFLVILATVFAAVRAVPSAAGIVICGIVAVYALRGPRQSIEALTILAFILLLGKSNISAARWLVLFAAFGRTVWDSFIGGLGTPPILRYVFLFFVTILLFSFVASYAPLISILKLITFTIGVSTAMTCFYRTPQLRDYWVNWFFTLGLFILFASLPLYLMGGGYEKTSAGFQGILSHPQTYGPVLTTLAALMTGQVIFGGDRRWYVVLGTLMAWVGIFMSGSRTALLATVLSFGLAVFLGLALGRSWRSSLSSILLRPATLYFILIAVFVTALQWQQVGERITKFLIKDDNKGGSIAESLEESRGSLIARSMENFRAEPLTGIGFGIPSNAERLERLQVGMLGLPTSASVEKGFMPSAVLEETGIVGAILVILLLLALFRPLVQRGYIAFTWMMATCVIINLGEMVFFSIGGMGFYFWLVMAMLHNHALAGRPANGSQSR